jgi:hypothetical protein
VRVHSQLSFGDVAFAAKVAVHNGRVLPKDKTIQGYLRGTVDMVKAMLNLYETVGNSRAGNGCTPEFVQLLSERCAPVLPCGQVHSKFAAKPGVSRLQAPSSWTEPSYRDRGEFTPLFMSSQWSALWVPHATKLATEKDKIVAKWWRAKQGAAQFGINPNGEFHWGSPDEWWYVTELGQRGFPFEIRKSSGILIRATAALLPLADSFPAFSE